MSDLIRFGVSLNSKLLKKFDFLIEKEGYENRSEAIRDLIRERLVDDEWKDDERETVGVFSLVYNHHKHGLTKHVNSIQHKYLDVIKSSTHLHINHDNCLEVIILMGKSRDIKIVSALLSSTKGIKHGKLIMTSKGTDIE